MCHWILFNSLESTKRSPVPAITHTLCHPPPLDPHLPPGLFFLLDLINAGFGTLEYYNWIRDLANALDAPFDNLINTNYFPLPQVGGAGGAGGAAGAAGAGGGWGVDCTRGGGRGKENVVQQRCCFATMVPRDHQAPDGVLIWTVCPRQPPPGPTT